MNNKSKTPTLYILTGLPYAGKTTLRRELVRRFNFLTVSIDEIMDEKNMWREGHPTQEDWNIAYQEAYDQIEKYLVEGKSLIFDSGNLPRRERKRAKEIAERALVNKKLIYINTSKEEILKRRMMNAKTNERGQLNETEMKTALEMFEEPSQEEERIIYNEKTNLDEWIVKNINE